MKNLLLTTALAICTAAAANAESTNADGTAMVPHYTYGAMEISADTMIGKRVYIGKSGATLLDDATLADGVADASAEWEDMGEIGDVLVAEQGDVGAVVIDAGGFLGMGEREVKVTMDSLQFVRDNDNDDDYFIVYTGDRTALEGTSEFDRSTAESEGLMTYRHDTMAAEGQSVDDEVIADPATQMAVDGVTDPTTARPDRAAMEAAEANTLTAEDLDGARVYGSGQDWIGDVAGLVLAEDGAISHMVIDVGGWLGMGEHPVALSFDQVDLRRDGASIVVYVDSTQEELEAMPAWAG